MTERLIEGRIDIARSPGDVFDFLADSANWATIDQTAVVVSPLTELALGSSGTVTNRLSGGLKATASWEIVEFVPGSRFTNQIEGKGYRLVERVQLDATGTGTLALMTDRLTSTSLLGRLMVLVSGGFVRRDLEKRSARLKELMESPVRS